MPPERQDPGALIDTRSTEAKLKDVKQGELVASAVAVNWQEKPQAAWRRFGLQDQDGSGSCVEQTIKKLAGINLFLKEGSYIEFSSAYYQLRSNKPAAGMIGDEAFEIWRTQGIVLEALSPSERMTDAEMDAIKVAPYKKDIAKIFTITGHSDLAVKDIDAIASTIQATGKGVMVWYYFTYREWTDFPTLLDNLTGVSDSKALRHSVTAIDFFLLPIGGVMKKCLLIEDSWGEFGQFKGQRVITEDFHKARNWYAHYPTSFKFDGGIVDPVTPKPAYRFLKPLVFVPWDDVKNQPANMALHLTQIVDVAALQKILQYEGLFPTNQSITGYYGALTAKAVYAYQVKYAVAPLSELDSIKPIKGGRVGVLTIESLNHKYGM